MQLKLYRGKSVVRTIYNVHKVSSEEYGALIVTSRFNQELQTKIFKFNQDYHRFIIEVD